VRAHEWQPPIVKTVAIESKGVEERADAIDRARESQETAPAANERRQAIARWRILELLRERLLSEALHNDSTSEKLDRLAADVANKRRDPYSAIEELIAK